MTATIGASAINRARLRRPRYGVAMAEILLTDDTVLPIGSRQTLTIGDLALVGTILCTGAFGGQAGVTWLAGAGAWGTVCSQRPPYHDDGGVMLSVVAADLARDAGEFGCILDGIDDRQLGHDWTRPEAPAEELLNALAAEPGQWWVADDGVTHLGPRPAGSFSSSSLTLHYDPSLRRGVAQLSDDSVAGLAPGITLTAQGLTSPILIASAIVTVESDDIAVVLYSEKTGAERFRAMVEAVTEWRRYLAAQPYTVATVGGDGRVAVQPMDQRSVAYPDAPALGHMPGVPGVSFTLAHGAGVAVSHLAGDPGSPVVSGYLPGVSPAAVAIDASAVAGYASPWAPPNVPPAGKITLGGAAPLPLVVAVDAAWFAQVTAAIGQVKAAGAAVALPGLLTALAGVTVPTSPNPSIADKAQASHL